MPYSSNRSRHYLVGVAALSLLLALIGLGTVYAQEPSRTFSETGKSVRGRFLNYWNEHGGLAQQGYPISEEIQERSDTDGKIYTVQYFERAVFEHHPEFPPPNDVLLSLLGYLLYQQKYPGAASAPNQNNNRPPDARYFPETGKWISGVFRVYWEMHGGLAQQGYPISNEFLEVSATDGKRYMVQYFQRAVFEYHPEFRGTSNEVLLSLLGTFRFKQKYPNGEPTAAVVSPAKPATVTKTPVMSTATPTNTPIPPPTNQLGPGQRIASGQSIFSSNGSYALTMRPDGNLVIADRGSSYVIWETGTGGNAGASAVMRENGNFVIVTATGSAIWSSRTSIRGSRLILQDTGALEIFAPDGQVVYRKPDHISGEGETVGPPCDSNIPPCDYVTPASKPIKLGKALKMRVKVQYRTGNGSTTISLKDLNNSRLIELYTIDRDHPDHIFELSSNSSTRVDWGLDIPRPGIDTRITISYQVLPGTRW